jgi:hypothetical protein
MMPEYDVVYEDKDVVNAVVVVVEPLVDAKLESACIVLTRRLSSVLLVSTPGDRRMQCSQCGAANNDQHMFCLGCGALLSKGHESSGEPGASRWAQAVKATQAAASTRCSQCGNGRTVTGAVGPALGVRVVTANRQDDLPLSTARVCVDCGRVALFIPEDARLYLASLVGR